MIVYESKRLAVTSILVALLATLCASSARAKDNLVANPGFEDPADKSWNLNNWFVDPKGEKSIAETALDTSNPHSGTYCRRVTTTKHVGGDLQLQFKLPPLQTRVAYELRFWIRGTANSKPVGVWILKHGAPYTKCLGSSVSCTGEWTEVVRRMVVPPGAPVNEMGLWFSMGDVGTFWIDDISLKAMPAAEEGEPLKGNLLANGSFEAGHDKWYANIHAPGGRYDLGPDAREEKIAKGTSDFEIVDMPDPPAGKKVLHWWNSKLVSMTLTSAKFRLRYGHPVTVSFWVKYGPKPVARNLFFRLASGEFGSLTTHGKQENIAIQDDQWHRYTFTMTPTPSADSRYFLEFVPTAWGSDFWLDGVTVTEGDHAAVLSANLFQDAGWARTDDAHPGNIYYQGEKVSFRVLASGLPEQSEVTLAGRVVDAWERPVTDVTVKVPLSQGLGGAVLSLPSEKFGAFKCELYREGERHMPAVEIVYHVVPRLTPLKQVKDSFFGGHVDLTPYNLSIAEKAGFRWLRYHGPADTKWAVVQPKAPTAENDGFVFRGPSTNWIAGTKRAHDMGFRIFGTFGKLPAWAEDRPEGTGTPAGFSSYPPKDYDAWDKYVVETVKAFSPYIQTWETWNEPDAGFLVTPPGYGQSKEDIVLTLAQRTRAALDREGLKVTLVGPTLCDVTRPLSRAVMKRNITQYLDFMSFHCYGMGNFRNFVNERPQWQDLRDRQGQELEYWQSEGGITSADIHTWLKTSGNIINDPQQMARDAAGTTQLLAMLKAVGVKKSFHYLAEAQPSGRLVYRNEWYNMIDVNGIPFSPLPAHAAAVYFLEDAEPAGLSKVNVDDATLTVCRFTRGGKSLDVVWSSTPVSMEKAMEALGAGRSRAFDTMANPLAVDAATMLSFSPVYLSE